MKLFMKRFTAGALFALFCTTMAFTQDSEEFKRCMSRANTQTAMHICASEELRRVDTELNDVYEKVLSAAAADVASVEKIKIMERAWIAYRDAYLDATYPAKDKLAVYGSTFLAEVNLLQASLTQRQISALKELLKHYGGSK
jgi:uncharacterized protein YecT (DUF1311 family)